MSGYLPAGPDTVTVRRALSRISARLEERGPFVRCVCGVCSWQGPRRRGVRSAWRDAAEHALLAHDLP